MDSTTMLPRLASELKTTEDVTFCKPSTQGMAPTYAMRCAGLRKQVTGRWKEGIVFVDI